MRRAVLTFAATVCAAFMAFASLILSVGIGAQTAHAAATTYNLTPLGPIDGPTGGLTIARGVNTSGEVVGQSQRSLGLRAFFWDGGTAPEDLGTLADPDKDPTTTSAGRGINDKGQVVGLSRINSQQRAFVAEEDAEGKMRMVDLGTLPGFSSSEASAINDNGQIVGRSFTSPELGNAFLYSEGVMKPLGTLPGYSYSEAWAINDKGEVVGESGSREDRGQAFLYFEGAVKGLGTLPGQPYSEAMGINDSGQIVGWSYSSRANVQGRAFLYRNGAMEDLGAIPGDLYSMARAIDEHGRVVGQSRNSVGQNRAFLWENGAMTDLNSLISPDDPDHPAKPGSSLERLLDAYAIGGSGQIVGSALRKGGGGQVQGFLLTPILAPNDATAPNTTANVSAEPNPAGWSKGDVTITLDAEDDEGGSNVSEITYHATGAQPIAERRVHRRSAQLSVASEDETTVTYFARDHAGNAEEPQTLTVRVDKTAPTNIQFVGGPAASGSYDFASVPAEPTCTANDATSTLESCVVSGYGNAVGDHTLTATATDKAGNKATETRTYTVNKAATTTTVTCDAGSFTYTGSAITPCSASVTGPGGLEKVLTVDYSNNTDIGTATASASYAGSDNYQGSSDSKDFTIAYNFTGFASPVDNDNVLNSARAGQAIPLKWRLADASGNPVTNLSSTDVKVSVANYSCGLSTTADQIEEYAADASGLQNLGGGYYQFSWKTPTNYANSCKTMTLDLGEGTLTTPHTALFKFTK